MRDRLIEIMQKWGSENTDSFPFESVADYLIANGVIVPPKVVYFIVDKGTPHAFVTGKHSDFLKIYEVKDLKKNGYFLTREEAERALRGANE